ncbi:CocE/NonD family hydrolase [Actinomadura darangshiensis]|uniref:alpha/beta hydrolase family protein n=1 Tax=Actinomadura darangshiensis TaxID=705336 RepID=UPI001A9CB919
MASYLPRIKAPTLLVQGQTDTLFNLQEAAATYRDLKAQNTPVKMIWHSGGHSGPNAPGGPGPGSPHRELRGPTGPDLVRPLPQGRPCPDGPGTILPVTVHTTPKAPGALSLPTTG